jgi:hypothetical protein
LAKKGFYFYLPAEEYAQISILHRAYWQATVNAL